MMKRKITPWVVAIVGSVLIYATMMMDLGLLSLFCSIDILIYFWYYFKVVKYEMFD